jgi:hypothetical protein
VAIDVRISGAMVGGTSSTINRKIEDYISNRNIVASFLLGFKGYTTTTSSTEAVGGGSVVGNNTVSLNTTTSVGSKTVRTIADMETLAVNGNKNILSYKGGNLIIECTSGITATELIGVRTVIVENGDLIINCNNGYGSSDISSSWAWIVKNGNIQVATGVTNIAGVYVSIGNSLVTASAPCG